jgi:acyl-CoA synthetase (AMP-forming)/AMP-acid ligase II
MLNMALNHPLDEATRRRMPPMATMQGAQEKLGWRVMQIYGLTETSPFLTVCTSEG